MGAVARCSSFRYEQSKLHETRGASVSRTHTRSVGQMLHCALGAWRRRRFGPDRSYPLSNRPAGIELLPVLDFRMILAQCSSCRCAGLGGSWRKERDRRDVSASTFAGMSPARSSCVYSTQGWEELLENLEKQRDRGEPLPEIDGFGSGEAEDSVS